MPNNTNPQVKTEGNPPSQPPPQIQEPSQQADVFPTHGTILTVTGGSNTDFDTKRHRRDYYRLINHVVVEGPITQTKWSHMPITFSSQDVNLALFPHTDTMVITVHIDKWDITKILIDNDSQAKILSLAAFDTVGFNQKIAQGTDKAPLSLAGKELNQLGSSLYQCLSAPRRTITSNTSLSTSST
jgi:hypothetical protein